MISQTSLYFAFPKIIIIQVARKYKWIFQKKGGGLIFRDFDLFYACNMLDPTNLYFYYKFLLTCIEACGKTDTSKPPLHGTAHLTQISLQY